jgi:hypothetical protein
MPIMPDLNIQMNSVLTAAYSSEIPPEQEWQGI